MSGPGTGRSREVRLGVVMYGGVSLAIYIYGVARELFDAVKGRGVFGLIKILTDSDVVVDVVSGTSAGGINGILLGYALANDLNFGDVAGLWRVDGDIGQLMRDPRELGVKSVLRSEEFYQTRLEAAFRGMTPYRSGGGDQPSALTELDLFVTGTDIDGTITTRLDDAGHVIYVRDHRSVFELEHRKGRKEPFRPDRDPKITYEALAKLARLTSCFPAAFKPVHVDHVPPGNQSADAKLQRWGALGKAATFLDGGVLDNKPFTHTLSAIFTRTAHCEVDRKLLYIEPDQETMKIVPVADPNVVQAVLAALIGIPGYESIADDLKMLAQHNSRLMHYGRLMEAAQDHLVQHLDKAPEANLSPQPAYDSTAAKLYWRSRLASLSNRVVDGLLRRDGRDDLISADDRHAASLLVQVFDELIHGMDSPDQGAVLDQFDVYFRERRVARAIYRIYDRLYGAPPQVSGGERERYHIAWGALNRVFKLYEIVEAAAHRLIDEGRFDWRTAVAPALTAPQGDGPPRRTEPAAMLWRRVESGLLALLRDDGEFAGELPVLFRPDEAGEFLNRATLTRVQAVLSRRLTTLLEQIDQGTLPDMPRDTVTILKRGDFLERGIVNAYFAASDSGPTFDDPVLLAWELFPQLDQAMFPLEFISDLREKDIIEIIRMSPADATVGFSAKAATDKIAGDSVHHFGGFFKRSWRSNDIMWGRVDGTCQLVELLFARSRVTQLLQRNRAAEILARFQAETDLDPAKLFPRSGKATADRLRQWIVDLFGPDAARRQEALDEDTFSNRVALLIEAAQLEVLGEEVPTVLKDALDEQYDWNRVGKPGRRKPIGGVADPLVAMAASAEQAQAELGRISQAPIGTSGPADSPLGRWFKDYDVGRESLREHVPFVVLLELFARASLVIRNCLLAALGSHGERVRKNLAFRLLVSLPMWTTYRSALLVRRWPRFVVPIVLACVVVAIALGVAGGWWIAEIVKDVFARRWWSAAIFFGGPVLALAIAGFLIWLKTKDV